MSTTVSRFHVFTTLAFAIALTACSKSQQTENAPKAQPAPASQASENTATTATATATADKASNDAVASEERLGTKWGDDVTSEVTKVDLKRLSNSPFAQMQVRYADKAFSGKSLNDISLGAGEVSFSVTDDNGNSLPIYRAGAGGDTSYYLSAQDGQAYQLHYHNNTGKTYEIVASVDGLDVLNGRTASRSNDGYVLSPYADLDIAGFRKSDTSVASFIFSKPKDAYANHNTSGSINNTGVIGTVVYELKAPTAPKAKKSTYAPPPTPTPNAFPADK